MLFTFLQFCDKLTGSGSGTGINFSLVISSESTTVFIPTRKLALPVYVTGDDVEHGIKLDILEAIKHAIGIHDNDTIMYVS